jgi:transcriptional regulator with XRE-family HTH domain
MTAKTIKLSEIRAKALANPKVKAEYEALKDEFQMARLLILMRKASGLTQQELADLTGIKQPQLARLETGRHLPRLDTLATLAAQAGYELQIEFVPKASTQSDLPRLEPVTISSTLSKI